MSVARVAAATLGLLIVACGGKAIVDAGGPGTGGVGGTNVGGANVGGANFGGAIDVGMGPGPVGPGGGVVPPPECVDSSGNTRPPQGDCKSACEILFCCATSECVGFDNIELELFVAGCVPSCEQNQALTSVVRGDRCEETISIVRGASQQFDEQCQNGL